MELHKNFPKSPHAIINPDIRWFPADEALRESSYEKLLPPLVHELCKKVKAWRDSGYEGATGTSIALLNWWFNQDICCRNQACLRADTHRQAARWRSLNTTLPSKRRLKASFIFTIRSR